MKPVFSGALVGLVLCCGCASVPAQVEVARPIERPPTCGVVFCADGAGGFGGTSRALRQAFDEQGIAVQVHEVDWSLGRGRVLADQVNRAHAEAEGRRLAGMIVDWRVRYPGQPIYLVGHSAGTAVVLTASAHLPPGSVERIVLLAPAVSASYDLRPALAGARQGIDVFYSERDHALGIGMYIIGTTDRHWSAAAGRVGFRPVVCGPEDAALYAKLRQHPWHRGLVWTGHTGGHYGAYRAGHLRAYVLPLLTPGAGCNGEAVGTSLGFRAGP